MGLRAYDAGETYPGWFLTFGIRCETKLEADGPRQAMPGGAERGGLAGGAVFLPGGCFQGEEAGADVVAVAEGASLDLLLDLGDDAAGFGERLGSLPYVGGDGGRGPGAGEGLGEWVEGRRGVCATDHEESAIGEREGGGTFGGSNLGACSSRRCGLWLDDAQASRLLGKRSEIAGVAHWAGASFAGGRLIGENRP